jgi:hypothetical protein
VVYSGETWASANFCATMPTEYAAAAARQRSLPASETPWCGPARAITATPANATAQPATSIRDKPSWSRIVGRSAIRIGATLTSIDAVPAASRRPAAFEEHAVRSQPGDSADDDPPQRAEGWKRLAAREHEAAEHDAPDREPASASAPGEKACPAERMPTKPDARNPTVVSAAAIARRLPAVTRGETSGRLEL